LRGNTLANFGRDRDWILGIRDISDFVSQQRANVPHPALLQIPAERVYIPGDSSIAKPIGISFFDEPARLQCAIRQTDAEKTNDE
jgi:hypothetical protein